MEFKLTIDRAHFNRIRDHEETVYQMDMETARMLTGREGTPVFTSLDDLKFYPDDNEEEAIRVMVTGEREEEGQLQISFELQEWMMHVYDALDRQQAEEKAWLHEYGLD